MLILDGALCKKGMAARGVDEQWVRKNLALLRVDRPEDAFFLELTADGLLRVQTRAQLGAQVRTIQTEVKAGAV